MLVKHDLEVEVESGGNSSRGVTVRWLVREEDGAPNFALRRFEVAPGGYSPRHSHPWEHEVYVLEGQGRVDGGCGQSFELTAGSVILVPGDEEHQFINDGDEPLVFLCVVPHHHLCR